jgi:hypothetical protein
MEIFEIHITGEKGINKEFDKLGIKNIEVELLTPESKVLRTEYMSSFISKHEHYEECKRMVDNLLMKLRSRVIRVKIESPYYPQYEDMSLYMESHFKPKSNLFPISRNAKSGKLMATSRTYDKYEYDNFMEVFGSNDEEVELCLFDTFVDEDKDWFELY